MSGHSSGAPVPAEDWGKGQTEGACRKRGSPSREFRRRGGWEQRGPWARVSPVCTGMLLRAWHLTRRCLCGLKFEEETSEDTSLELGWERILLASLSLGWWIALVSTLMPLLDMSVSASLLGPIAAAQVCGLILTSYWKQWCGPTFRSESTGLTS